MTMQTERLEFGTEDTSLRIIERGAVETVDLDGLERYHEGDAWWGLSVGFRAMQLTGALLSETKLWDRENLYVVSGHPGPGVRDAIEYVTRCVSRKRFRLLDETLRDTGCSPGLRYEWWVSNGRVTASIRLRDGFVPREFFDILERLDADREQSTDRERLDALKRELCERIWRERLTSVFESDRLPRPLDLGELPEDGATP